MHVPTPIDVSCCKGQQASCNTGRSSCCDRAKTGGASKILYQPSRGFTLCDFTNQHLLICCEADLPARTAQQWLQHSSPLPRRDCWSPNSTWEFESFKSVLSFVFLLGHPGDNRNWIWSQNMDPVKVTRLFLVVGCLKPRLVLWLKTGVAELQRRLRRGVWTLRKMGILLSKPKIHGPMVFPRWEFEMNMNWMW